MPSEKCKGLRFLTQRGQHSLTDRKQGQIIYSTSSDCWFVWGIWGGGGVFIRLFVCF